METLIPDLTTPAGWLPLAFLVMMAISMAAYVILDGFDLGVGILLPLGNEAEKDRMIASIGPFWDANETWLVLGVGILLVAFPMAHGVILGALYLPVSLMLVGLTLRGVAFDFRVKAHASHKHHWNRAFFAGSLLASVAQGYMLGRVILGFETSAFAYLFALFIGACLASAYCLLAAGWLVIKTDGPLQRHAIRWARRALGLSALGIAAVSIATPWLSNAIFQKWFSLNNLLVVWPIPLITAGLVFIVWRSLGRLPVRLDQNNEYGVWVPFGASVGIVLLAFHGLAYSLFPWLVLDKLSIWDAASAPESLFIIFVGAAVVLPVIAAYSVFAYRVFRGKAESLSYE